MPFRIGIPTANKLKGVTLCSERPLAGPNDAVASPSQVEEVGDWEGVVSG